MCSMKAPCKAAEISKVLPTGRQPLTEDANGDHRVVATGLEIAAESVGHGNESGMLRQLSQRVLKLQRARRGG